ncbi:uncharacterized protein LOC111047626 [Nilaparvata lugens]|uniref:uncharacterized protein LOC111047626 n=1 Tax=Nilaparvata lugens TaxID=108931 RepID=UPI00193D4A89|nr:uncharacterized protein LOC111047626 [Nilaparvata lugens]
MIKLVPMTSFVTLGLLMYNRSRFQLFIKLAIFSISYIPLISSIPLAIDVSSNQVLNSIENNHSVAPFWENPCGLLANTSEPLNTDDVNATYTRSLRKIRQHLKMAQQHLTASKTRSLLFLNTRKGLDRDNYNRNWIPDINSVTPILESNGVQTSSNYGEKLSVLYSDLQRFAVAFEQMQLDEGDDTDRRVCLTVLTEFLRELLCEVESTIIELGNEVPQTIARSVMSPQERSVAKATSSSGGSYISTTQKMIRDNGILFKYKEFLEAWLRVYKIARRTNNNSDQ